MTTLIPAICKGDTLKLEKPLDLPENTRVTIALLNEEEREEWLRAGNAHFDSAFGPNEGNGWSDDELRAFEATAYCESEPDYGTLDSLK